MCQAVRKHRRDLSGPNDLVTSPDRSEAVFRLDALALSVIATATWLGVWVAVTLRYCIKTAKPIGKLFRPSESPIILVF